MTGIELPKTMPAVVCHGPYDYRLEEVPVPNAEPGEVVIQVQVVLLILLLSHNLQDIIVVLILLNF